MDDRVITKASDSVDDIIDNSQSADYGTDMIETVEQQKEVEHVEAKAEPKAVVATVEAKAEDQPKTRPNPLNKKADKKDTAEELFGG